MAISLKALMDVYNEDSPHKTTQVTVGRYEKRGINFTIQTITPHEAHQIANDSIGEDGKSLDNEIYNELLLETCFVDPDLRSQALLDEFGVLTTSELLTKMFLPNELIRLARICDAFAMRGELPADIAPQPQDDEKKSRKRADLKK